MASTRPLPGIRFEPPPAPPGDVLPRMDVPLFVGFSAAGPIDRPVAVEDAAEFADLFGADLALPRDAGSRQPRWAQLAPAVRSFFRNGGRRCWIVRVAHRPQATANIFPIPGLHRLAGGSIAPANAVARSEGSWSDVLRVRTSLVALALEPRPSITPSAIDVTVNARRDLAAGDLLRLTWPGTTVTLFLAVESLKSLAPAPNQAREIALRAAGTLHWVENGAEVAAPAVSGAPVVERLTFDLAVTRDGSPPLWLAGLGFAPAHPRYFGALPPDRVLFGDRDQLAAAGASKRPRQARPETAWSDLWREAAHPRFPVAADVPPAARFDAALYLPLTMMALAAESGRIHPPNEADALERDGVVPFDAALFLDSRLAAAGVRDLVGLADFYRSQSGSDGFLRGIHAALLVDEATLVAVPDAIHRGWQTAVPAPAIPPEMMFEETPVAQRESFFDCMPGDPLVVPTLHAFDFDRGSYTLSWTPLAGAIDTLEEALHPDLSDAVVFTTSTTGIVQITGRADGGVFYYRVRRSRGGESVLSAPIVVSLAAAGGWLNVGADHFDDETLVTLHEALVTMSAARGDLVAVLSLPGHYDETSALVHAARLEQAFAGRPQTLSYGALWHPWLICSDEAEDALREQPPDGAVAGMIAARANLRGAWIAAANVPLRGVVALAPHIAFAKRQALQDAAVNIIRQEPRGFMALDADTLSGDDDLRPLNVRRLLILIRRAALTLGNAFAFEPNGGTTRRALKGAVTSLLTTMFRRGAFAGSTPRSAFQVATNSGDAASLITEVRVAPSRPLTFLTVRMLQSGGATQIEEGR